jgi:hypothetical protein
MAQGVSPSFIANMVKQKRASNETRRLLGLGERGVPQPQRGPPPVAPAQPKAQKKAATTQKEEPKRAAAEQQEEQPTAPAGGATPQANVLGLSEEQRQQLLVKILPFLERVKAEKRAKLHRKIGRARRFFGGGV